MTDYYLLIAKAVTGLQSAQDRRTLYARGRTALLVELKAIRPPLGQSIIAKEQLAFEDAIRKLEAELAGRAPESG